MSLASGVQSLATRIAAEIRDVIMPRLLPSGGTLGQVLRKASNNNYQVGWVGLHEVAATGSYEDLENKPDLAMALATKFNIGGGVISGLTIHDDAIILRNPENHGLQVIYGWGGDMSRDGVNFHAIWNAGNFNPDQLAADITNNSVSRDFALATHFGS